MPESKTTPAPEGKKNDAPVTATPKSPEQKQPAPAQAGAAATPPKQPENKSNVPPKEPPKVPPAPPTTPSPPPKTAPPTQAEDKGKGNPEKKPEQPGKADAPKPAPAAEPKKHGEKAAPGDTAKGAAATDSKKGEPAPPAADPKGKAPADPKQPEVKSPAADPKGKPADAPKGDEAKDPIKVDGKGKVEIPVEPKAQTEGKTAQPTTGEAPPSPAQKGAQTRKEHNQAAKDFMDGKATIDGKPIEPLKSVPIGEPKAETAAGPVQKTEGAKGIVITQIFADRLEKPTQDDLQKLPIPKEGEGFSMRLHPAYFFEFLNHPFSVNRETDDYKELYDSIKENGINEPIKARPREGGGLELISGHRRHDVAMQLNYPVPVVIVQADNDSAQIECVDGNLHRKDIPTSELARAAKMKIEAMSRKVGRRSKMEQLTSPQKRTDQIVAEEMGYSRTQLTRLVRIDSLVPEMKKMVDDKKLPFNVAVELSHMTQQEQHDLVGVMKKEQTVPSLAQALQMKEASQKAAKAAKEAAKAPKPPLQVVSPQTNTEQSSQSAVSDSKTNDVKSTSPAASAPAQPVTAPPSPAPTPKPPAPVDAKKFASIMKNKPEPELKVTFTGAELKDFFPGKTPTVPEVKSAVFEALGLRKKLHEKQAKKQDITSPAR